MEVDKISYLYIYCICITARGSARTNVPAHPCSCRVVQLGPKLSVFLRCLRPRCRSPRCSRSDELESCDFQYRFLLCPNQQENSKSQSFPFVLPPHLFFKTYWTLRGFNQQLQNFVLRGYFNVRNLLVKVLSPEKFVFFNYTYPTLIFQNF